MLKIQGRLCIEFYALVFSCNAITHGSLAAQCLLGFRVTVQDRCTAGFPGFFRQPRGLRAKHDLFKQAASIQERVHKSGVKKLTDGKRQDEAYIEAISKLKNP